MTADDVRQWMRGIVAPIVVATLVGSGSAWINVQVAVATLEEQLAQLRATDASIERRLQKDEATRRENQILLIRIDERTLSTDKRLRRLERSVDNP